jgi:hypothetical protein
MSGFLPEKITRKKVVFPWFLLQFVKANLKLLKLLRQQQ